MLTTVKLGGVKLHWYNNFFLHIQKLQQPTLWDTHCCYKEEMRKSLSSRSRAICSMAFQWLSKSIFSKIQIDKTDTYCIKEGRN